MANPEHLAILKQGVEVWNEWREENPNTRPDLSRIYPGKTNLAQIDLSWANLEASDLGDANLSHAFLIHADFCGDVPTSAAVLPRANLRETNLAYANLSGAYLCEADLRGAYLMWANLSGADLSQADLSNTTLSHSVIGISFLTKDFHVGWTKLIKSNLSGANLFGAMLIGPDLTMANLSKAKLGASIFADVDLGVVKGLNIVNHVSPSTLGLDTIYRSRGRIPEVFLRGCGMSDEIIALSCSLREKRTEYLKCFISHSSKDKRFLRTALC